VIGQFHGHNDGYSPPFAFELFGERLAVKVRHLGPDGRPTDNLVYLDPNAIERGRYYEMTVRARFADDAGGHLEVWRDGERIVNYTGPMGYGEGVYWKLGLYRHSAPETIAMNVRNLFVTGEEGVIVHRRHSRAGESGIIRSDG
jgi:hypothetical protein